MGKLIFIALVIVLLAGACGGLAGILWCYVFAVPLGILLAIVGKALGWL